MKSVEFFRKMLVVTFASHFLLARALNMARRWRLHLPLWTSYTVKQWFCHQWQHPQRPWALMMIVPKKLMQWLS